MSWIRVEEMVFCSAMSSSSNSMTTLARIAFRLGTVSVAISLISDTR